MVSLRFYVLGTMTALTLGIIYFYRRFSAQKKSSPLSIKACVPKQEKQQDAPQQVEEQHVPCPATPQVSSAEIELLVSLLASSNINKFKQIIKTLIQFSNDNANMV